MASRELATSSALGAEGTPHSHISETCAGNTVTGTHARFAVIHASPHSLCLITLTPVDLIDNRHAPVHNQLRKSKMVSDTYGYLSLCCLVLIKEQRRQPLSIACSREILLALA